MTQTGRVKDRLIFFDWPLDETVRTKKSTTPIPGPIPDAAKRGTAIPVAQHAYDKFRFDLKYKYM